MRRWNGWGEQSVDYPLPEKAKVFLHDLVGPGVSPPEADFAAVVDGVPSSHLPDHPLVSQDPGNRVRYARGQSLPDWVALRYGRVPLVPDGVAFPTIEEDVQALIDYAKQAGARLIPYGGGTSVVGHINPLPGEAPVLTVNLERLNKLHHLDQTSHLAAFGAGVTGPDLEAHLRAHGYTLGHYPQSFEYSTLGGWIATRSSGQQSLGYGRIEDLFSGGRLLAPGGTLDFLPHPASAAGPDLRQLLLGSEGRMGIITQATVRVSSLPEREDFHAVFFPDFPSGVTAVRQMLQAGLPLSMLRLSTAVETTTTLALAGHKYLLGALEKLLALRGAGENKAMLMLGLAGQDDLVKSARKAALSLAGAQGGVHVGRAFGRQWHKNRFRTPYLRNTLWEMGYAIDTLETATTWGRIKETRQAIESALHTALGDNGERIHVFTHLSHMYADGASIYTTYLFRLAPDPEQTLTRWRALKTAASQAIVANKGTISHQHGVGLDHAPYLPAEKGDLGMASMRRAMETFDPEGMMNPGKLF